MCGFFNFVEYKLYIVKVFFKCFIENNYIYEYIIYFWFVKMFFMGLWDVVREFVRLKVIMLNLKFEGFIENYKFFLR